MTSARFTDEELSFIDQSAHEFLEKQKHTWRDYFPFEPMPWARKSEWKIADRIHEAAGTIDGSRTNLAATSYTWDEAALAWFGFHFEWPEIEIEIARQTNNNIRMDDIKFAYRKLDKQIERAIWQGAMTWDEFVLEGVIAQSTDLNSATADAVDFEDTGGAYIVFQELWQKLQDGGIPEPYYAVISDNLKRYMKARDLATDYKPAEQSIREAWDVEKYFYVGAAAPGIDSDTINPYPAATANDGLITMFNPSSEYGAVQEVFAPKLTIIPEMDQKKKIFYGRLDYFYTVKVVHDENYVHENSINIAT